MSFTVKDLFSIPLLQSANLLAGEDIQTTKMIQSVTIREILTDEFVRKDDLVLTTAIGCGENASTFCTFVEEVFSFGAAAIAVATGQHVQTIPQQVIDFCRKNSFPLIELPWGVRFADIIQVILGKINQWEQTSLYQMDLIQRGLLERYLDNQSLEDALSYLSGLFQREVIVTWANGDFVPTGQNLSEIKEIINHHEPTIITLDKERFAQLIPFDYLVDEPCQLILISTNPNSSPISWNIANHTISLLSLWIQKEQNQPNDIEQEKEDFIKNLINGTWDDRNELMLQGQMLQIPVHLPFVCIVGVPEMNDEFSNDQNENLIYRKRISTLIRSTSKKLNKQVLFTFHQDLLVIYLEMSEEDIIEQTSQFLDVIDSFVESKRIPLISWGIGENDKGNYTFHEGYINARRALEFGRTHAGPGKRNTYANTVIYQVLDGVADNTVAQQITEATIGTIALYEKSKGLDLIQTLETYLELQGNVSQTARELNLHRQSLLYRLRKIEKLIGRSLSDPNDLFLLQFCLKLWRLQLEGQQGISDHPG